LQAEADRVDGLQEGAAIARRLHARGGQRLRDALGRGHRLGRAGVAAGAGGAVTGAAAGASRAAARCRASWEAQPASATASPMQTVQRIITVGSDPGRAPAYPSPRADARAARRCAGRALDAVPSCGPMRTGTEVIEVAIEKLVAGGLGLARH